MEWIGARSRNAYDRPVWRRAQLAMENETIWRAVTDLADELIESWEDELIESCGGHDAVMPGVVMPGARARSIMRKAGVVPGLMLTNC